MNRLENIRRELKDLHAKSSDECMRTWFYHNHVEVVAKYAKEVAQDVGVDIEIAVLSALFHDIARTWGVMKEPALMNESLDKTEELMKRYGYSPGQIQSVRKAILHHSCRVSFPDTKEGKVLATADALAHLMTDFYILLHKWKKTRNFEEYKNWVLKKIERDFNKKIFYAKYRKIAKKRYEALKTICS